MPGRAKPLPNSYPSSALGLDSNGKEVILVCEARPEILSLTVVKDRSARSMCPQGTLENYRRIIPCPCLAPGFTAILVVSWLVDAPSTLLPCQRADFLYQQPEKHTLIWVGTHLHAECSHLN